MYVAWIDVQSLIPLRLHHSFDVNENEFKKVTEKTEFGESHRDSSTKGKEEDKIEALKGKRLSTDSTSFNQTPTHH